MLLGTDLGFIKKKNDAMVQKKNKEVDGKVPRKLGWGPTDLKIQDWCFAQEWWNQVSSMRRRLLHKLRHPDMTWLF